MTLPPSGREPNPTPSWVRWLWDTPWLWLVLIGATFCVPLFIGLDRKDLDNDGHLFIRRRDDAEGRGLADAEKHPSESRPFRETAAEDVDHARADAARPAPDNEFGLRFMDAVMGALAFLASSASAGNWPGLCAARWRFSCSSVSTRFCANTGSAATTWSLLSCSHAAGIYHFWRGGR